MINQQKRDDNLKDESAAQLMLYMLFQLYGPDKKTTFYQPIPLDDNL